jgi:ADP-heptose:LPS heptosyltransferase
VAGFRRVVAWHLGALGDLVLAVPALHALRRGAGPGARVEALAAAGRGEMLVRGGAAHAAADGTRADLAPLFVEGGRPPGWLADRLGPDALVALFFGGADVLTRNLAPFAGRVMAIAPRPPGDAAVHCADFLLAEAARSGPSKPFPASARLPLARPRLRVSPADRHAARRILGAAGIEAGCRFLALHPGSGGRAKRWPEERFLALAARARAALGLAPLLVTGPVERDLAPDLGGRARAAGAAVIEAPPLPALAAILSLAAAYAGNDSGPTHMAAAVGAPTLALFGPSDPRVFAPRPRSPRGAAVRVIEAGAGLAHLPPEAVIEELRALADRKSSRSDDRAMTVS